MAQVKWFAMFASLVVLGGWVGFELAIYVGATCR